MTTLDPTDRDLNMDQAGDMFANNPFPDDEFMGDESGEDEDLDEEESPVEENEEGEEDEDAEDEDADEGEDEDAEEGEETESEDAKAIAALSGADLDRKMTIRSAGKDKELSLREIVSLAQKGDHYSESMRSLKEERQSFAAKAKQREDAVEAQTASVLEIMGMMRNPHVRTYQHLISNPPGPHEDQGAWAAGLARAQAAVQQLDMSYQQVAGAYQRTMLDRQKTYEQEQIKAVRDTHPDWGHEHNRIVEEVLDSLGLSETDAAHSGQILGAYELGLARRKIADLEKQLESRKQLARKPKPVPKQVPRKRATNQQPRRQAAYESLKKTGSLQAAGVFFEED